MNRRSTNPSGSKSWLTQVTVNAVYGAGIYSPSTPTSSPKWLERPIRNHFGHSRASFLDHFINLLKGAVRAGGSFHGRVRLLFLEARGHPLRDRSFP